MTRIFSFALLVIAGVSLYGEEPRPVSREVAEVLQQVSALEPRAALQKLNAYDGEKHALISLARAQTLWRLSLQNSDEVTAKEQREQAEQLFQQCLSQDASIKQAHVGLAQCAAQKNNWPLALKHAAQGIDALNGNASELTFLAQCAVQANDWRLASIATQQGILRFPADVNLRRMEIHVLLQAQRNEEARHAILSLLNSSSDDLTLWKQFAFVASRLQRDDETLAALEAALLLRPDDKELRRTLGERQLAKGFYLSALTTLQPLLGPAPHTAALTDAGLISALARAGAQCGQLAQARAWLAAMPASARTRDTQLIAARLAVQSGETAQAGEALEALIASGEKDPNVLTWAGTLAEQRGDGATAELLFISAAQNNSAAGAAASLRLVALYLSQKRTSDAQTALAAHVVRYPDDRQAAQLLQQITADR
jgi:thioredoxin-like negative regulator of GroEL